MVAQSNMCSALGQNPATAFPVCGTAVFSQSTVPVCGGLSIPGPCSSDGVTDKNPFWYQFTCFQSGALGFVITPNDISDDYDWQLFDITNHSPSEVYTNPALFVACDWSGVPGLTGASSAGSSNVVCGSIQGGPYHNPFSLMPLLIQGHTYLLLISHFTDTDQSGYTLSFSGGNAVITDSTAPHLQTAIDLCGNERLDVVLDKKMKCNSLASNGSDFYIRPAASATPLPNFVIAAISEQCSNGFDMDSIRLTLKTDLPLGDYFLGMQNGSDGNTIADNCNNTIPLNEEIPFTISLPAPSYLDSIAPVGCAPNTLKLVFKSAIDCSSIAPDGSDFIITGSSPVTIVSAQGTCDDENLSNSIYLQLDKPIKLQGTYTITLQQGDDHSTIVNQCGLETPAGSSLNFTTKDTVSALFGSQIKFGCKTDTIVYTYTEKDGVNEWLWTFDSTITSQSKDTSVLYSVFNQKEASLIVSNGVCSDTASASIYLDNTLKASFEASNLVCPGEMATFQNNSIGQIISWNWDFNNGNASTLQSPPPQTYFIVDKTNNYAVTLTIQDSIGCRDSLTQYVEVVDNCYIAVPSAFTPNGDGLNDYLYPLNAYRAINLTFKVFNRWGQLVFETNDWTKKWDGTFKNQPASAGTYVWLLQYTDSETGKDFFTKGTTVLIR